MSAQKEIRALKKLAFALDKKRTVIEQELMALIQVHALFCRQVFLPGTFELSDLLLLLL